MFIAHTARRAWWVALVAIAALGLVLMLNGPTKGSAQNFPAPSVRLSTAEEVPPVTGNGGGQFFWNLTADSLEADLSGDSTDLLTAAHIHLGAKGTNGPVIAALFSSTDGVRDFHVLPVIKAANLAGPMAGKPFADFAKEVCAGNTYVNIHSKGNPAGLIRAQIPAQACAPGAPRTGSGIGGSESSWFDSTALGAALAGIAGGALVLSFARSRRRS
ncbi:MAG: CHRD domain-containing protein [Dehalococcoidia bacterium]